MNTSNKKVATGRRLLAAAGIILASTLVLSIFNTNLVGCIISGTLLVSMFVALSTRSDLPTARAFIPRLLSAQIVFAAAIITGALVAFRSAAVATRLLGALLVAVAVAVDLILLNLAMRGGDSNSST
jgi:hypothetical protein